MKLTREDLGEIAKEFILTDARKTYVLCGNSLYLKNYDLDDGSTYYIEIDIEDIKDNVKSVVVILNSVFVLTNSNNLWVCGRNDYGQLGINIRSTYIVQWTKITVNGIENNVKSITNNQGSTFLVTLDNNLWVCGRNNYGQLGTGDLISSFSWIKITVEGMINNIERVSDINVSTTLVYTRDKQIFGCGYNNYGTLCSNDILNQLYWKKIQLPPTQIEEIDYTIQNNYSLYIITKNKRLFVCGYNGYGQFGLNTNASVIGEFPVEVADVNISGKIKKIFVFNYSTYIITDDDTLWTAGLNNYGQLGLGHTSSRYIFTKTTVPALIGEVDEIISDSANLYSTYLLTKNKELYVAGRNHVGQLGVGTVSSVVKWTKANLPSLDTDEFSIMNTQNEVIKIMIQPGRTFIVTNGLRIYATGDNSNGELMLGDRRNRNSWTFNNLEKIINNYSNKL